MIPSNYLFFYVILNNFYVLTCFANDIVSVSWIWKLFVEDSIVYVSVAL